MDQRDDRPQSFGICQRLFYFITKAIFTHLTRPVTLGQPSHCNPTLANIQQCVIVPENELPRFPNTLPIVKKELPNDGDRIIHVEQVNCDDGVKSSNGACVVGEKADESGVCTSLQLRVAKKMVSIKDEAEVIDLGKKRRRFSFDKQMSMKRECNVELRPLKSILRVGSNQK